MEKPGEDSRDAGGVPWGLCARAVPAPGGAGGLWAQAGPATDLRLLEGGSRGPVHGQRQPRIAWYEMMMQRRKAFD